jgi:hypothetical protein
VLVGNGLGGVVVGYGVGCGDGGRVGGVVGVGLGVGGVDGSRVVGGVVVG